MNQRRRLRVTVIAAEGLAKRDIFGLPDPFAVLTVDGEQTQTTPVSRRSLNPFWNAAFDCQAGPGSVLAVQVRAR